MDILVLNQIRYKNYLQLSAKEEKCTKLQDLWGVLISVNFKTEKFNTSL